MLLPFEHIIAASSEASPYALKQIGETMVSSRFLKGAELSK